MVTNAPLSHDVSLPAALAARARSATDGRLRLDVTAGLIAALSLGTWRPFAWPIGLSAAIGLASFGIWGIAEREIQQRANTRPKVATALRVLQVISIGAGSVAAVVAVFVALGIALGTIVS